MAFLEYSPRSTLFQYTSESGMEGMFRSKRLWLSDLQSTNDPREVHLGRQLLQDAFSKVRHESFQGSRGLPISILAGKLAGYLSERRIFSASFTYDGDALPMWREYGDDGFGYAVGFRVRSIADMPVRVQRVSYLPDVTVDTLAELVRGVLREYEEMRDISSLVRNIAILPKLISPIVTLKHGAWAYEREIRITHATEQDGEIQYINGDAIPTYTFPDGRDYFTEVFQRKRGDRSVNYVSLPFGKYAGGEFDPSMAIERVILGPRNKLSIADVEARILNFGFRNFKVLKSDCLIR